MEPTLISCKNCNYQFSGNYCNNCGEKVYTDKDRHLSHFIEESFHFVTHFEGKFFTTIKTLFSRPGQVSLDYTEGIRKKYFKLLSLFLLLVILYLLFPFFEGLNMELRWHKVHNMYGGFATKQVDALIGKRGISETDLSILFHKKSETLSKTLLLLIIPLTAVVFWAVTFRRRKYFFDQMVFSTEINSIYLLWGFLLLPLLFWIAQSISNLFNWGPLFVPEWIVGMLISIPLSIFTGSAARRFYGLKHWQSVLFGLFYIVINIIVVHYIYKFILFTTVINSI